MLDLHVICETVARNGLVEVLSPSVGRAELFVREGELLAFGQVFGKFWRLSNYSWLHVSGDLEGRVVTIKNHDRLIALAYGEPFLFIDQARLKNASDITNSYQEKTPLGGGSIDAPMDGMFYLSPTPKDPPFVSIGDEISPGQTLGLIEVMKCFYPITYKGSHKVKIVGINVKNATAVNCGSKLYYISI